MTLIRLGFLKKMSPVFHSHVCVDVFVCMQAEVKVFFLLQGCLAPRRAVPQKSEVWPFPSCNWTHTKKLDSNEKNELKMSLLSQAASCSFLIK